MKKYLFFSVLCFIVIGGVGALSITTNDTSGGGTINVNEGNNGFVYSTASDNNGVYAGFDAAWNNSTGGGILVATFTPNANETLHILGLGIGGDVGGNWSTVVYYLTGGGLNFTFSAGNSGKDGNPNLYLGSGNNQLQSVIGGSAELTAQAGATVYLKVLFRNDPDGGMMNGSSDPFGNTFYDSGVSSTWTTSAQRVWINYETLAPVPEPASLALFASAILAFFVAKFRR